MGGGGWRGRAVAVAVGAAVMLASGLFAPPPAAIADAVAPKPQFGATFVDPYQVWNYTDAQLDSMFAAQKQIGVSKAILQWTGVFDGGVVRTIYTPQAGPAFVASSTDLVPRLLASAHRKGVSVDLGLVLRSSLLDDPSTRADSALLSAIANDDRLIASDLLNQFGSQFDGWYIPTEPGYATIADPQLLSLHSSYLTQIASSLHSLTPSKPVMVSPSVPRAIEGGLTGVEFVSALAPIIRDSGIDIWNLQDGFMMTNWTSADNRALVEKGQALAHDAGASVWVTLYLPGPAEVAQGAHTVDAAELRNDLAAVTATGATAAIWTFASAMNPDPTVDSAHPTWANARSAAYNSYRAGGPTVWSLGAPYTSSSPASSSYPDSHARELSDGRRGTLNLTDPAWQGRENQSSQSYTLDLGSPRPIDTVTLGSLRASDAGIQHPSLVAISTSLDGVQWRGLGSAVLSTSGSLGTWRATGTATVTARYVRAVVQATTGWTFLDEFQAAGSRGSF